MDDKRNTEDLLLEDILREFSDHPEDLVALSDTGTVEQTLEAILAEAEAVETALSQAEAEPEAPQEEAPEAEPEAVAAPVLKLVPEQPEESAVREETPEEEVFHMAQDPEEADTPAEPAPETPVEEKPVQPPIAFRSRTRLQELKRQIVNGPEKRYYQLTEIGLGRVQLAILANFFVVLLCIGAAALYAAGMVPENRLRLMIFSQVLSLLVSALLGCYVLMDGMADLFKLRFSLNSMLFITFLACCVDGVLCLQELRVPCCAAFSLEMTMALWNRSLSRSTEMGQMDTLRKAVRLDSLSKVPDYYDGRPGIVRGEGNVSDFMDVYQTPGGPAATQNVYSILALLACCAIAAAATLLHNVGLGIQIFATSLLVAVPASFFVVTSRPSAILQRRLHMVGTVICGWQGVKGLCGSAAFPLRDADLFPGGATKLNGVKFYSDRNPDETVAYAASLMTLEESGLSAIFGNLLKNRNGVLYEVENYVDYPNGGIGGEVDGEPVLMGSLNFIQSMGVEIPEGTMVNQAVYCAIDGQLSAVFAIAYAKMKSATAGLITLGGYRKVTPVLVCGDFMIDESFLGSKFGINTRRIAFPDREVRRELKARTPDPEQPVLALITQDGLAASGYAVTGARALRTACKLGLIVHIVAGVIGLLIMAALAILGSDQLLTPFNVLLYQVVWLIPGLLISSWTRTV